MTNRERTEIYADILGAALKETIQFGGALKTHIMYKANLSHRQLEHYIPFLSERGMLLEVQDMFENGRRRFIPTDKGIDFLRDCGKLYEYLKEKETKTLPGIKTLPEIQVSS